MKIMIQGTGSSVGKSILVTALCRIFKQDGYSVCPYKSQNMSLNSYITLDGKEMGRAQVLQAYAAGLEPEVYMNPILLKPTSDKNCQVIVNGEIYGNSTAVKYHDLKVEFKEMLKTQFEDLEKKFDIIVMEGAGSPAEINLRDKDIVNMGIAELVDAPVLLVGDIDKGGVFASLYGTLMLISDDERKRVKGLIINKFRGDVDILRPGIVSIEEITDKKCIGVVPCFNLLLEEEDRIFKLNKDITNIIDVAVLLLPHISNSTDFDVFKLEEDVSLRFITSVYEFRNPDLLIIPGSKNTIEDLDYLRKSGLFDKIKEYSKTGQIIGICGGYQMLGKTITDQDSVESKTSKTTGLSLLDIETALESEKATKRVEARLISDNNISVYGYEIHNGISIYGESAIPLFSISKKFKKNSFLSIEEKYPDGSINIDGSVLGTYIHGVFDKPDLREFILNKIREKKGVSKKKSREYEFFRENELDKLADIVRNSIDVDEIYNIMNVK
ncbi:MAG: cobyric acid synthase [Methanobrevibacter sp.]|jgi:adenosylcobyric acid synthase|nr:cobyric acid synthase [Candidatus Methanovirga basalitermitum]